MVVPPVLPAATPDVGAVLEGAVPGMPVRVGRVYAMNVRRLEPRVLRPGLADAVPVRHIPQDRRLSRPGDRCERHPAHRDRLVSLVWTVAGRLGLVVPDVGGAVLLVRLHLRRLEARVPEQAALPHARAEPD